MKIFSLKFLLPYLFIFSFFLSVFAAFSWIKQDPATDNEHQPRHRDGDIWVSAYLASWQHNAGTPYSNWGKLTTRDINWDAFTHLFYFSLGIGKDGRPRSSLDPEKRNNLNTDRLRDIVPAAHRNQKKILFSVGGSGSYEGFSSAIKPENRSRFIGTIVEFITVYGFDGVDLDMEPIYRKDHKNYRDFVFLLHREFSGMRTKNGDRPLITIAALKGTSVSELYAGIQQYVDQINIMTYDMAQAWEGWQAWHNSALYSKGMNFDSNGSEMSSIEQKVEIALDAGIEPYKLGIGVDFYGYIWHGVHYLGKWQGWPDEDLSIMERPGGVPYYELNERFNLQNASWDTIAQTPYLNVENPKAFVSFDNERSVQRKVQFAIEKGLGGIILWELGGGFIQSNRPGEKSPLLDAVKQEAAQYRITP
ncbi:MAG: glycoside hydrolase family 18 protein [Balneolaceae bacterium]